MPSQAVIDSSPPWRLQSEVRAHRAVWYNDPTTATYIGDDMFTLTPKHLPLGYSGQMLAPCHMYLRLMSDALGVLLVRSCSSGSVVRPLCTLHSSVRNPRVSDVSVTAWAIGRCHRCIPLEFGRSRHRRRKHAVISYVASVRHEHRLRSASHIYCRGSCEVFGPVSTLAAVSQ